MNLQNFYKKCQGINFKNPGRTENLIRRMFPSVIRGGENTNIVNIEMATENMPNRKFSGNVIAMLQRLGSLLDDNFENVLHSIHLMPEGYPSLSFPLFFMSNFLSNTNSISSHSEILLIIYSFNFRQRDKSYRNM